MKRSFGVVSLLSAGGAFNWYSTATEEDRKNYAMQIKACDFVFSSVANSFHGLGQLANTVVFDKIQSGSKIELERAKAQIVAMEDAQKKTDIQMSQLHNKIERTDIESMKRDMSLATQGDQTPYGGLTHIGYVGSVLGAVGLGLSAVSTAGATAATTIGTGAFMLSGGVLGVGGAFLAIAAILRASQPQRKNDNPGMPVFHEKSA